jgi:hypothetical protein
MLYFELEISAYNTLQLATRLHFDADQCGLGQVSHVEKQLINNYLPGTVALVLYFVRTEAFTSSELNEVRAAAK